MQINKKIILFDIDYTLFDANKFRRKVFKVIKRNIEYKKINNLDRVLKNAYIASRQETGYFKLRPFLEDLSTELKTKVSLDALEKAILKEDIITGNLYEGAKKVLHTLSKNKLLRIGIFSGGDYIFQRKKIEAIENFLHKEHIHIFSFKKRKELPFLVKKYKRHKLYIVDDILEILHTAKLLNKNVFTIWIKRRRFAKEKEIIPGFTPDATIVNLEEVSDLVERNFQ